MNNSKVKVVADATTGAVINTSPNNPDYGYVMLEQVRLVTDEKQFLRKKRVTALVQGEITLLNEAGFYAGQELPGVIAVKEKLVPFNTKYPDKDLKVAGSTGIVCRFTGTVDDIEYTNTPIYRKHIYFANPNELDDTVKHTNVEEIKMAYAIETKSNAIKANSNFDNL